MKENLDHVIPRKKELAAASGKAKPKLRMISDELAPFIEKGYPVKFLLKLIKPLDITHRANTVREFIQEEFPDQYARYYSRNTDHTAPAAQKTLTRSDDRPDDDQTSGKSGGPVRTNENSASRVDKPKGGATQRLTTDDVINSMKKFSTGDNTRGN